VPAATAQVIRTCGKGVLPVYPTIAPTYGDNQAIVCSGVARKNKQIPVDSDQLMKTHLKNLLLPTLISGLGLMLPGRVKAETFTTLHTFTSTSGPNYINSDGDAPFAGLVLLGNVLYGTASYGGNSGNGTVFAINTDGTGFKTLHQFSAGSINPSGIYTNSDGTTPKAGMILSGNILYGTAQVGGSSGNGTVFKLHADGTAFTILHTFAEGSGFSPYLTNSDGAGASELILSGNTLYGTTRDGGSSGGGTVFAVNTDGTGFTNLHTFIAYSPSNTGGYEPWGGLIWLSNTLYGTTRSGGSFGAGTVFAVNTDGTGFTNVHSFNSNTEGYYPDAGMTLYGNTLFGTTQSGADMLSPGGGTVFAINTDGTYFTTLHNFAKVSLSAPYTNIGGANPYCKLILSGDALYGTMAGGGTSGSGTIFSITLPPPQLTIVPSQANLTLTWPTNATGFTLESATSLGPSAVWTTNSTLPVVINGFNIVTSPISGRQDFYRLSQ
jgi:uncharacterized repeat protein (TIGR03803 family)